MQEEKRRGRQGAWLLAAGVVFLIVGLAVLWMQMPPTDMADATNKTLVAAGCKQAQTIVYGRCGHQVLRRLDAPAAWAGMSKDAVEAAMEEGWRMTTFASDLIEMSITLDMFCSQHYVLTLSEEGVPGIYRNRYGFEMEEAGRVSLTAMDESTREMVSRGIAFDTEEALLQWVEEENRVSGEEGL